VNIFDPKAFAAEVEKLGTPVSKADTIAYRTKRTISERMGEDPAFYEKFSKLLEDAIAAFRAQRLSDADYLRRVGEISVAVRDRTGDEVPESLRHNADAKALFGVVRETLAPYCAGGLDAAAVGADAAAAIDGIIQRRRIVNWVQNPDVQNQMRNDIEDHLFELKARYDLPITVEVIDEVMERCLDVARVRKAS